MIESVSILSKCFVLSVANGRLLLIAVAAINKSAISICFRLALRTLFISTAAFTASLSNGKTVMIFRNSSQ